MTLFTKCEFASGIKRRIQGKGRHREFESNQDGRNQHEGISNDLDFTLIEKETAPEEESVGGIELQEGVFVNPCTGSISSDTSYNDKNTFPCLNATNMPSPTLSSAPSMTLVLNKAPKTTPMPTFSPSKSPKPSIHPSTIPSYTPTLQKSNSPSISSEPSTSNSPTTKLDTISCPEKSHNCSGDTNNTIVVDFKYSIETTNQTQDPYIVLPKLEKTLLQYLAEKLLDHCMNSITGRQVLQVKHVQYGSKLAKTNLHFHSHMHNKKRITQNQNYTDIVGLCSLPEDVFIEEGEF